MKLTILGGGGFRTPYAYEALLRDTGAPRIDEVTLYDTDTARLATMQRLLTELAAGYENSPKIHTSSVLEEAISGAGFVFSAVRVGGLLGRQADEHVALDLGILGQETTGPGGISFALRTIPVMMSIARSVKRECPDAYVINFTNPAGIITEAMQGVLGDRVVGICDTPSGLGRRIARLQGVPETAIDMDYVGLNHLGWMRHVYYKGEDILSSLVSDADRLAQLEETAVFGADWIRMLGAVPNEYLYYYYCNRDAVQRIRESKATRGDFLLKSQSEFYEKAVKTTSGLVDLWRNTVRRRSGSYMAEALGGTQDSPAYNHDSGTVAGDQGYAGVALRVMNAISRDERSSMILNVRNRGAVNALPDEAVIEIPTMVDANGVHPLTVEPPTLHQSGLMSQVKEVERLAIRAALEGSHEYALKAFALHPLVGSLPRAKKLLDGYLANIPELGEVLVRN